MTFAYLQNVNVLDLSKIQSSLDSVVKMHETPETSILFLWGYT